jgi:hypothetical protein
MVTDHRKCPRAGRSAGAWHQGVRSRCEAHFTRAPRRLSRPFGASTEGGILEVKGDGRGAHADAERAGSSVDSRASGGSWSDCRKASISPESSSPSRRPGRALLDELPADDAHLASHFKAATTAGDTASTECAGAASRLAQASGMGPLPESSSPSRRPGGDASTECAGGDARLAQASGVGPSQPSPTSALARRVRRLAIDRSPAKRWFLCG